MDWSAPKNNWAVTDTGADIPAPFNTIEGDIEQMYSNEFSIYLTGSRRYDSSAGGNVIASMIPIPDGYKAKIKRFRGSAFVAESDDFNVEWRYSFTDGTEGVSDTFLDGANVEYGYLKFAADPSALSNSSGSTKQVYLNVDFELAPSGVYPVAAEMVIQFIPL